MNPEKLTNYRSYADFGVRHPLPVSLVGELKYEYKIKSRDSAVKALYEVTRQCVFYLGAFGDEYDCAVGLVADATDNHIIYETFAMLPEALRDRFGERNRLHLMVVRIR
jgi:hypothetical protein